jgi:hypothetical protein
MTPTMHLVHRDAETPGILAPTAGRPPSRDLARGRAGGRGVLRWSVGFDRVAPRAGLRQTSAGATARLTRTGGAPPARRPARSREAA